MSQEQKVEIKEPKSPEDKLVDTLQLRITERVIELMNNNNASVYMDGPVPVSFIPRTENVTVAVLEKLIRRRIKIRHCVVSRVVMADMSKASILVTLAPDFSRSRRTTRP